MTSSRPQPAWVFVVFPAVAMLLGWGLRGYIGGGPFGALIPGAYVALSLALLLGYTREAAAIAALFGAVGVGYGGNMTYGQTLGFLLETDTVWWGLLGCLVKGGVWGLLGGAVLGAGLTRNQFDRKSLTIAFILTVIAFYVGVKMIDEPKLIYFSNRLDKPRDESWAGLLFAALAFLGYLYKRGAGADDAIPRRFALWGMLGGALGFSGGALWMVFGPSIPIEQKWTGWWKMMEFSFGFIFGAALGWCAYLHRERLGAWGRNDESPGESWGPVVALISIVLALFLSYPVLAQILPEGFRDSSSIDAIILRDVLGLLFGFVVFGGLAIMLGMRSLHAAWQVAVTLTFFHTVLDFVLDLSDAKNFGYVLGLPAQLSIVMVATATVAYLVFQFQRGRAPIQRLYLLAVWSCYISACARSFLHKAFFFPPPGESALSVLIADHASLFFVHGTFTVSAIVTTWFIQTRFGEPELRAIAAGA